MRYYEIIEGSNSRRPGVTLRHLHQQKLRQKKLKQEEQDKAEFLNRMYGVNSPGEMAHMELERAQVELASEKLEFSKSLLDYQREFAEFEQENSSRVKAMATREAKRALKLSR